MKQPEEWITQRLQAVFPGAKVRSETGGYDLVVRHRDGSTTAFEIKSLNAVRKEDLIGRLATGVLQLRGKTDESDGAVIVAVPRASPTAAAVAEAFMRKHAPDLGWGIIDPAGGIYLELPSKSLSVRTRAERAASQRPATRPATLFSDLHTWLLKLLLLRDVEQPLWNGPREPIHSVQDLQRVGNVARITAYRFVKTFESADFLRKSANGFTIVRRGQLLRAWLAQMQLMPVREFPVRSIRGGSARAKEVFSQKSLRWAIAGFEAAAILGLRHASQGVIEIHVDGDVDEALRVAHLSMCDRRDADFILLQSGQVESIFRGCSHLPQGNVVDVLQAALDAGRHATRGKEQSQYILHEALGWRDA